MKKGFLSITLHAHLPYVRHPEHESFFEENWLFEAVTESYIPLINVLDRLAEDNVRFKLTLSLSPTLITMLQDDLLRTRYLNHLNKQQELARLEISRTAKQPRLQKLAIMYSQFFQNTLVTYQQYHCDLLSAFKKHHNLGHLELITTAATHGFLPLLNVNQTAVYSQINVGIETFKDYFGFTPSGFWLPECGYYQGLESILKQLGIKYFFTDTHGVLDANHKPVNNVYAPLDCGNGVMAFARDPETSQQVWSAEQGYPGNENYREYYSDIGFDTKIDLDYLKPYILEDNTRINTGIKYHRITGPNLEKEHYDPEKARYAIDQDVDDFIEKCKNQIDALSSHMDRPPLIVSPYDAELFGHWWFEGPSWLEKVLRTVSEKSNNFETISCSDYLQRQYSHQIARPCSSTWGAGGYSNYWISKENEWIYPFLHSATEEMEHLALDFRGVTVSNLQQRALNQALRSILLAQASDWPFILKSGTTTEYARKRVTDHLARFNYLHTSIRSNRIDERYLLALETMDNIFPEIDFRKFKPLNL